MIRILHNIGNLYYGGSQSLVMSIYRQIDRSKVQFDFVTTIDTVGAFYDEAKGLGAKIYVCPQYKGTNHKEFCLWWNQFFDKHNEYRVIHGHVRSTASIYLSIAKKHGLVTIAHSHSTSNGKDKSSIIKNLLQLPLRYIADWCFACSDEAGQWLFGKNIINSSSYRLISNAIDGVRFSYSLSKRNDMRRALGVEEKIVIGHNGRFTPPKNHFFLIDIFEEIYKINSNAYLLLIGDGELKSEIERYCIKKGLEKSVLFLGTHNNVENYYQAMDVFLFPSKWEGLGIVAIEAQASGLPCVVSKEVPDKVDIGAGLVKFLSLDEKPKKWAMVVLNEINKERHSHLEELVESGYEIKELAKSLSDFYIREASK